MWVDHRVWISSTAAKIPRLSAANVLAPSTSTRPGLQQTAPNVEALMLTNDNRDVIPQTAQSIHLINGQARGQGRASQISLIDEALTRTDNDDVLSLLFLHHPLEHNGLTWLQSSLSL